MNSYSFCALFVACFCIFFLAFQFLDRPKKPKPIEDIHVVYLDPQERLDPLCVALKGVLTNPNLNMVNRELALKALDIQKEKVHQEHGDLYK